MINLIKVLNLLNKPIKWLQNIKFRSKINSKFNANECYGGSAFFLFFWKNKQKEKYVKTYFFLVLKKKQTNKTKTKNIKTYYIFLRIFLKFFPFFFLVLGRAIFSKKKNKK